MLRKFFSTSISDQKTNIFLIILRASLAILMIPHGYQKIIHFAEMKGNFMNFLGLSGEVSLGLVVLAEFFCSILLAVGLLTRLALIPLIIAMIVATFQAHNGEIFGDGQMAALYLITYLVLFISGPGKYSADHYLFNQNRPS